MEIELQDYQHDFIYSEARHPAGVMGWGCGKTMCSISRSLIYSRLIPDNLGVIFRKTAKSLFDSTLRDFEQFSGYKADSQRNMLIPSNVEDKPSTVMFRHIDEIGDINQQNINLGWYYIEQGEELETDKEFYMLFGRLRRKLFPSEEFLKLKLPIHSGWIIANACDNWIKSLWKDKKLEEAAKDIPEFQGKFVDLIEANTWQNAKNLPAAFLASLKVLEKTKPEIYQAFVMNDWSVGIEQYVMLRRKEIQELKSIVHDFVETKKIISCDPSLGGDACVILVFENTKVVEKIILRVDDTMKIVGELLIIGNRYKINDYAIDSIGIGKGIADRLSEMGKNVVFIISSEEAYDKTKYFNRRSEMWGYTAEQIRAKEIEPITDEDIIKQLLAVRYDPKAVNSQGFTKVVPKQETKKLLGRSPDEADAYVYGIWGLKEIKASKDDEAGEFGFQKKKKVFSGAGGW